MEESWINPDGSLNPTNSQMEKMECLMKGMLGKYRK